MRPWLVVFLYLFLIFRISIAAASHCHFSSFCVADLHNKKSEQKVSKNTKKNDIIAFIRASILQPEQLEGMIPTFVKRGIASCGKHADIEEVINAVRERILSDAFIEKLILPFESVFSQEELQLLTTFYQSEAMKKCFKHYGKFSTPIFIAFREVIQEVLEAYPSIEKKIAVENDQVVSITKANYQKELQESTLPVVLDVYANWCEPCKLAAPIFSQVSKELVGKVKFAKLDIDKEQSIAIQLGVEVVPTFLFFKEGKIVQRRDGVMEQNILIMEIIKSLF